MANRWGKSGNSGILYFLALAPQTVTVAMKLNTFAPWKNSYDKPIQCIKKQTSLCQQNPYSQSYGFSNSHVQMWELDHKEGWALKNWCFRTVVLEKTLESPLDSKEIKPVDLKGNQPWIFIGKTNAEAEAPILWPPDTEMTYWKRLWYWERLKAGGEGGNRGWDGWMVSSIQWTWVWANWEIVKDREAWWAAVHGVAKSWTQLSNWTTLNPAEHFSLKSDRTFRVGLSWRETWSPALLAWVCSAFSPWNFLALWLWKSYWAPLSLTCVWYGITE